MKISKFWVSQNYFRNTKFSKFSFFEIIFRNNQISKLLFRNLKNNFEIFISKFVFFEINFTKRKFSEIWPKFNSNSSNYPTLINIPFPVIVEIASFAIQSLGFWATTNHSSSLMFNVTLVKRSKTLMQKVRNVGWSQTFMLIVINSPKCSQNHVHGPDTCTFKNWKIKRLALFCFLSSLCLLCFWLYTYVIKAKKFFLRSLLPVKTINLLQL
jgi:hypothetical protein